MRCPSCGSANDPTRKFCGACGSRLALLCPACGSANSPADRFCGECGSGLEAGGEPTRGEGPVAAATASPGGAPAERRVVSVLFADLVGFTGLAEDRDPEAVRDLLTRYFELAREVIGRYGGTVEKFIGDAVMAVWGVPITHEDDPERAVRAGLELVDVVRTLGGPTDDEVVEARAGVLTGEVAVSLGATDQGLVAGDLVNVASRLQSVAPAGAVLVGESTWRATAGAIAYEPAGEQLLRGRAAPVPAWRAQRVLGRIGGLGRSEGLEPPFVGRDVQLRLVKDMFHAAERDRRLRFVSVTGQPGTGKSRLVWELRKYIDGLAEDVYWHQGRSPAYGEGISFWALGEMVRKRAGLAEGDDASKTRAHIAATLAEYVPDEAERGWIEPTLLGLLGLEELRSLEREELFAAWRTFFERVSDRGPTVLVFEDVHWADQGLLDFIDSLSDWSADHPILLLTLARPELLERRPDWGVGRRGFNALSLDPLPDEAMDELLAGIVPGLSERARRAILSRADGIPLYAVETVRMLILEGHLEQDGEAYRPVGELELGSVPDTLQALIAARLDALEPAQRSLLQDASILGQTFAVPALAAVSGSDVAALEPRLRDLVRRDVLLHDRDPRSPERGQYGFVQALIREVAYGSLARRDRRARHLAAARYFESLDDEELAGALAAHYLDAYRTSDPGPEADAIGAQARIALRSAAERAASLHSPDQALAYLAAALEVTVDPAERAALLELAGEAANRSARAEDAQRYLAEAIATFRHIGDRGGVARTTAMMGLMLTFEGRPAEGIAILEPALTETAGLGETRDVMLLRGALARSYLFADDYDRAIALSDQVLLAAGKVDDVPLVTDALITKGTTLMFMTRYREGVALMTGGLELARKHGLVMQELRARLNISFTEATDDPGAAVETARVGLEKARRLGIRYWSLLLAGNAADAHVTLGAWDEVLVLHDELVVGGEPELAGASDLTAAALTVRALRGAYDTLGEDVRSFESLMASTVATQERMVVLQLQLWLDIASGRLDEALARPLAEAGSMTGATCRKLVGHVAVWSGDVARASRVASGLGGGIVGRWASLAERALGAGVAALEGRTREADLAYAEAIAGFEELGTLRDLALVHMDRAAVSRDEGTAREAADEATRVIERLGAVALGERLSGILARRLAAAPHPGEERSAVPTLSS